VVTDEHGRRRHAQLYQQPDERFVPWLPQPGYLRVLRCACKRLGFDPRRLAAAMEVVRMTARKSAPARRKASGSQPRTREVEQRTRVFVYGTLLVGERNHHLLEGARRVAEARTRPAFALHDFGPFPGLVAGGNDAVLGEVYEVDEPALAALDQLEGHPSFYQRTSILLEDGTPVQAYLLRPDQVSHLPVIPSGSWRARHKDTPQ
jgi:gamma-glutamylaminecyclotransferase